jgi:enoyl-CoA hydratase/carnithine racemase
LIPIHAVISDHLATIRIQRPEKRNAMTLAMWVEVTRLFTVLARDESVRAIILTGETDFSVGADISEFPQVRSNAEQCTQYEVAVDACTDAIASALKPTIAVINGYCIGGACHLAMACDFRFLSQSAEIGIPAARLSIIYGVRSTQRLLNLVGLTQAKRILFSAERLKAEAAVAIGFGDRLGDTPLEDATAFARTMANNAPLSISGAKFILDGLTMGEGALDPAAAQIRIDQASDSNDYLEGQRAFAERRAANFSGR